MMRFANTSFAMFIVYVDGNRQFELRAPNRDPDRLTNSLAQLLWIEILHRLVRQKDLCHPGSWAPTRIKRLQTVVYLPFRLLRIAEQYRRCY